MTVAIAVIAPTAEKQIVTASDAMISFGNFIPATDEAVMKNMSIAHNWGIMYAASDSTAFQPVLDELLDRLHPSGTTSEAIRTAEVSAEDVRRAAQAAYEQEFDYRFFTKHLARFGFEDIGEFRRDGYSQLGKRAVPRIQLPTGAP